MKKVAKTISIKEYQLPVIIAKENGYFVTTCPSWSDCYAQGKTIDEAMAEIISVASSLIELYQEERAKIPLKQKSNSAASAQKLSFNIPQNLRYSASS